MHGVLSGPWHTGWHAGIRRATQRPSPHLQRQLFCRNRMKAPTRTTHGASLQLVFSGRVPHSHTALYLLFQPPLFLPPQNSFTRKWSDYRKAWLHSATTPRTRTSALSVVHLMPSVSPLTPFCLEPPLLWLLFGTHASSGGLLCLYSGSGCDGLLYLTTASWTRHLGPLTNSFSVHFIECKLKSAVSCSEFFRNNVQTFPASALNGSFFAKFCLLP